MREIIARAKTTDKKEWIEGGYFRHQNRTLCPIGGDTLSDKDFTSYILTSGFSDWNMAKPIQAHEVIPETVCEYTGYQPKCGKIFENDILGCILYDGKTEEYLYEEGVVSFLEGAWKVSIIDEDENEEWHRVVSLNHVANLDKVKIVGNVIDNPERADMSYWDNHSINIDEEEFWTKKD